MNTRTCLGLLIVVALLIGLLVCGAGACLICRRGQDGQPVVRLLSPPEGTQVAVGRQIYIQARASARGNVARVDFGVNGSSIGSRSPSGSQRIFAAAQPWTPAAAGTYTLSATAYDAAGQASDPAQVTIAVLEPGNFAPPSPTPWSGSGPSPTPTTPSGGGTEPVIDFRADRTSLPAGECTTLRWDAEYVQEVYLDGAGVSGHGTRDVCPPGTTTYVLHVVLPSGESRDYTVTVEVTGGTMVTGPDLAMLAVDCPGGQSDESIPFQAQVQNAGDQAAQNAQWRWSVNTAGAGPGQWNQGGTFNLDPGATTLLQGSIPPQAAGDWTVYVEVQVAGETVTGNNQGSANFVVTGPQGDGGAAPAAPTNLRVPSWGMTYIRLMWDDNSDNEDGFQVFQQGRQDPVAQTGPNENQAQIDNPPCGQTLQFHVRAFNAAGNSAFSNTAEVQTSPCGGGQGGGPDLEVGEVWCSRTQSAGQDVPFRVEVRNVGDAAANGATWSWIVVERGQDPGAHWLVGGTFDVPAGGSTVLEGTARGLAQGNWTFLVNVSLTGESNTANNQGSYDFSVAAAQGGGGGGQGQVTNVSVSVNPVSFSGPCPHTVTFNGSIKTNGPCTVQYQWVRDVSPGSTKSITFDAAGTQTVTGDWTLRQSGTYGMYLRITAPNGTRSNTAQFQLTCSGGPPAKPTNLRVTNRSKTSINLAWNDNSDDEDTFTIEISPPPHTAWGIVESVGANTHTVQITGLTCGQTYRFRVRAHNDDGFSGYSNEVEGTTRDCN